jgi:uncharacterized protein
MALQLTNTQSKSEIPKVDMRFVLAQGSPASAFSQLLVLFGLVLLGLVAFQALAIGALWPVMGGMEGLTMLTSNPEQMGANGRLLLLALQAITALGAFVLAPLVFVRFWAKEPIAVLSPQSIRDPLMLLWPVLLVPVLAPLLELTIEWNKNVQLPEAFKGIETWAQSKEGQLKMLTEFLLDFQNPGEFALGLIVVALIPAVGEELLFRGVLQPVFQRLFRSAGVGILVSAVVFSAIHIQFYGFVPRMLLGLLFGYLYHWSGNLLVPIAGHFANNALSVVLSYLYNLGALDMNPDAMPSVPLIALLASAAVGGAVLYRFRARYYTPIFKEEFEEEPPTEVPIQLEEPDRDI